MPAPISVIIPTLDCARTIGPTLGSVYEAVQNGLLAEVIFCDGGSDDEIRVVADDVGAEIIAAEKGRGSQLAAGAEIAKGKWLLFLHADTVLSDGWSEAVRAHMNTSDKAGYFRLAFNRKGFGPSVVAGLANIRSRVLGLPYGDQGLLVPASLYRSVGGYPVIPLMEDVALVRALKGKLRKIDATATTDASRFETQGWFRRSFHNLGTLSLYFLGRSPAQLVKRYQK